jgi:hypothetical protein
MAAPGEDSKHSGKGGHPVSPVSIRYLMASALSCAGLIAPSTAPA